MTANVPFCLFYPLAEKKSSKSRFAGTKPGVCVLLHHCVAVRSRESRVSPDQGGVHAQRQWVSRGRGHEALLSFLRLFSLSFSVLTFFSFSVSSLGLEFQVRRDRQRHAGPCVCMFFFLITLCYLIAFGISFVV